MKKKAISLLALALLPNFNAQIFNAGFENNNGTPLSQFKTINADGLQVPAWAEVQDFNDKAWIQFYDGYDNKIAFSTSYYDPEGQSNDWLITPAITIPASGTPTLYWKAKSYDFDLKDSYAVKVSVTDNNAASFTTTLLQVNGEQPYDFANHSLDLSDYKGKTVYLAFINNTDNGTYLALDDLYISQSDKCQMPSLDGFSVSGLTPNSVTVMWPSTSGINNYDTGLTTFDTSVTSSGITSSMTKKFSNLQSEKRYQFFLKNSDCGSGWAGPRSVWTPTLLPYSYDFEKTIENFGEYDSDGWASNTWLNGDNSENAQSGNGYVFNNTSKSVAKNDWIFSYPIYLKKGETVTTKYYSAIGNDNADPAILKISVASAQDKDNIFQTLSTITVSSKTYTDNTVSYTANADGIYYIGFGNATPPVTTTTALRIDNVSFTKSDLSVSDMQNSSVKIYPNPVTDFLNINTQENIKDVEIYTIDGKLIRKIDGNNNKIDFKNDKKGAYIIKIQTDKSIITHKVLK